MPSEICKQHGVVQLEASGSHVNKLNVGDVTENGIRRVVRFGSSREVISRQTCMHMDHMTLLGAIG
jgi:hypothetical protein